MCYRRVHEIGPPSGGKRSPISASKSAVTPTAVPIPDTIPNGIANCDAQNLPTQAHTEAVATHPQSQQNLVGPNRDIKPRPDALLPREHQPTAPLDGKQLNCAAHAPLGMHSIADAPSPKPELNFSAARPLRRRPHNSTAKGTKRMAACPAMSRRQSDRFHSSAQ